MKLQIVLLVLVAMALSASTEKSTGRRSNIRLEQLLRNQKDSPSKARFLWNKKQQAPASQIYVIQPGYTTYTAPSEESVYQVTTNGTETYSPVTSNSSRSFDDESVFDDDDEDKISFHNEEEARVEADDDDDEDDVQTSRRHQKQKKNLKLQKVNARDQGYKVVIPAKYLRSIKKNAHASRSANFNNGVNKLRILRLNDKSHTKRKLSSN